MKKKLIIAAVVVAAVAGSVFAAVQCSRCNGTGWINGHTCVYCNGTGRQGG